MTLDAETLLERFFSAPNTLGPGDPQAISWVQLVRSGAPAYLLPRRHDSGSWTWYAVGTSDVAVRGLREEVAAFVGPTYARLEGEDAILDPADPPEAALRGLEAAHIFRVHAAEDKAGTAVTRQLELMQLAWSRRPLELGLAQRTTSQLLRALDSAMRGGQLRMSRDLLDELHATGRLSSVNLECLEIWWLAAQERWAEVLVRSGIDDLVALRLPRYATAALIDAVYHVHLEPHEDLPPEELVTLFAARVAPRFGRLFRDPKWSTSTPGRKAWLLFAASTVPASDAIRDAVMSIATPAERTRLAPLAEVQTTDVAAPEEDAVQTVGSMLESGDYQGAWRVAAQTDHVDAVWRARVLLYCAYETADPTWAATALAVLDEARDKKSPRLQGRTVSEQETSLRRLVTPAESPIADWYDWLASCSASATPRELVALARDRSEEWDAVRLLERPDAVDLTLDVLTSSLASAEAFREARPLVLPAIFAAAASRPDLTLAASQFLLVLADGLVGDDRLGLTDLDDLAGIAEFLFACGLTADEYRRFVLGPLAVAWQRSSSLKTLGWLADMVELLGASPCPDSDAQLTFVSAIVSALSRFRGQVAPEHWDRAEEAFDPFGRRAEIQALRPRDEDHEATLLEWQRLAGHRVFVYTLVEQAGERARRYLKEIVPDAVVDVWAASVAEDRMLDAVRASSLVVIATKAAKHAATLAIERAVRDGVPVSYPTGKGWSSIVSAIREALPALEA